MKKGSYMVNSSKIVYKNPWIEVREDQVIRSNGKNGIFGTVDYGEGVTIVAVNKKKQIYLIKEYYYVLERKGIQTPSGGIDENETPLDAAKKELEEEAGLIAKEWIPLGKIDCLTTIIRAPQYLFLALDLEEVSKKDEEIEVIKVLYNEAEKLVKAGEITYAPSIIAITRAKEYLKRK